MQMTFDIGWARQWRAVSWFNPCAKTVAGDACRLAKWLVFTDGLGNGGAL